MPARVKCAEIAWRTLKEMLEAREGAQAGAAPTADAAGKAEKGA